MKKRSLFSAILSIVLCMVLIVGSTFALFTAQTKSSVAVTSGKVDVVAVIDEASLELYSKNVKQADTFENGGTATFADAQTLELDCVTPGDKATFDIIVTNNSNVTVQYRVNWYVEGELAGGLVATADGVAITNSTSAWNKWGTDESNQKTVAVAVELPLNAGNEYQEKSAKLTFVVEAVQGNGADLYGSDIIASPETIDEILSNVPAGTTIGLAGGFYDEIVLTQDNLTILGDEGAVVGMLNVNAKDGVTVSGVTFDASSAKETYTFATGNKKSATGYIANITGDTDSPKAADGLTVKNCTFVNTTGVAAAADLKYVPIYFNEQGAATERASGITVENCVFACDATNYIVLNYLSAGEVVIRNNVFGGACGTEHNTINATSNAANWTITGNEFNNWNVEKTAIGSSKQGSNHVTFTLTDNTFNHVEGAVILALKTSYTAANSTVIVEDNKALGGNANIVATDVNAENEAVYGGHKLEMKENVSAVTNSTELTNSVKNNETVVLLPGVYTLPTMGSTEGVTLVGGEGVVVGGDSATTGFGSNFGKNTTIKDITFSGASNGVRYSYAKGGDTVFENCTFAGGSTYGFHIDQSNGANFTFNNCTFSGFNAFAGDLASVTFNNCTFLHNGNYGHTNIWSVGYFNNCTFGDKTSFSTSGNAAKIYVNGVEESYHHEFIGSAESLVAFANSVNNGGDSWKGQKVVLVADIDLAGIDWEPIGQTGATEFKGFFDGQGYTIYNLSVDSTDVANGHYSSGLFGWIEAQGASIIIENLNVVGATVTGHHNVAVIAGYLEGKAVVRNCSVSGATIVNTHANDEACGDKSGLIAGYAGGEVRITNCTAADSTVTGGRDAGQLFGASYTVPKNCSATNVTVEAAGDCTGANIANDLVGRKLGSAWN